MQKHVVTEHTDGQTTAAASHYNLHQWFNVTKYDLLVIMHL